MYQSLTGERKVPWFSNILPLRIIILVNYYKCCTLIEISSRVLILAVKQNNIKTCCLVVSCAIISLAISDRNFSRSFTVRFVFLWA